MSSIDEEDMPEVPSYKPPPPPTPPAATPPPLLSSVDEDTPSDLPAKNEENETPPPIPALPKKAPSSMHVQLYFILVMRSY